MPDNEQIVREFIGAWSRLDPAELGVFEMQDGKIRKWRDDFDLNTFMQAMKG